MGLSDPVISWPRLRSFEVTQQEYEQRQISEINENVDYFLLLYATLHRFIEGIWQVDRR